MIDVWHGAASWRFIITHGFVGIGGLGGVAGLGGAAGFGGLAGFDGGSGLGGGAGFDLFVRMCGGKLALVLAKKIVGLMKSMYWVKVSGSEYCVVLDFVKPLIL